MGIEGVEAKIGVVGTVVEEAGMKDVPRFIAQKSLPAKQIVKFAPWMIERQALDLPAVRKAIRFVHTGRRSPLIQNSAQRGLFRDSSEA